MERTSSPPRRSLASLVVDTAVLLRPGLVAAPSWVTRCAEEHHRLIVAQPATSVTGPEPAGSASGAEPETDRLELLLDAQPLALALDAGRDLAERVGHPERVAGVDQDVVVGPP